jgi:hypothetical protein
LRRLVYFTHGSALLAFILWPLPPLLWLVALPLLAVSCYWQLKGLHKHRLTLLYRGGEWWLQKPGGKPILLEYQPGSWITRWLVVLYFRRPGDKFSIPILVATDAVDPIVMRRLRVLLKLFLAKESGSSGLGCR